MRQLIRMEPQPAICGAHTEGYLWIWKNRFEWDENDFPVGGVWTADEISPYEHTLGMVRFRNVWYWVVDLVVYSDEGAKA